MGMGEVHVGLGGWGEVPVGTGKSHMSTCKSPSLALLCLSGRRNDEGVSFS